MDISIVKSVTSEGLGVGPNKGEDLGVGPNKGEDLGVGPNKGVLEKPARECLSEPVRRRLAPPTP